MATRRQFAKALIAAPLAGAIPPVVGHKVLDLHAPPTPEKWQGREVEIIIIDDFPIESVCRSVWKSERVMCADGTMSKWSEPLPISQPNKERPCRT